jgi:hypothetical protein
MQHYRGNTFQSPLRTPGPQMQKDAKVLRLLINLHNLNEYYVPIARLATYESPPLVYFPKIWNDFSNPISSIAYKNIFKKEF